ncbi:HD domain protein [delta proteobacterium NaphS2]|nr:HD domain protein [delta proteobacterium NaphS2]
MLKAIYERIWDLARPYLNTRKNDTHTEIAAGLAQQLLAQEGGDEDVVMPAIILHDTGWKKVPEDVQLKAFGPKATSSEWNRVHEVEGARIAGDILRKVDYPDDKILEIQEIIKGHDSRKEALSINDGIVKDADKLWRYSQNASQINVIRFGVTADENVQWLRRNLETWFLTKSGKQMAKEALEERIQELKEITDFISA